MSNFNFTEAQAGKSFITISNVDTATILKPLVDRLGTLPIFKLYDDVIIIELKYNLDFSLSHMRAVVSELSNGKGKVDYFFVEVYDGIGLAQWFIHETKPRKIVY